MTPTQITLDKIKEEFTAPLRKELAYLEQENSVLHQRLRDLEIKLERERESCARIAESYDEENLADTEGERPGKAIAQLIRGRTP